MARNADRPRKDQVLSITVSKNTRLMMDLLAGAYNMSRSEYIRFLAMRDAETQVPTLLNEAIAEKITVKRGRVANARLKPGHKDLERKMQDSLEELNSKYYEFLNTDEFFDQFFNMVDGELCIVHDDRKYTIDDWDQLSNEDKTDLIAAVREARHADEMNH